MKIVTLIENLVESPGLAAEHGLSMFIDTGEKKILFDTGQSDLFLKNALELGIDIGDIDAVVLSHGHHDHTGGLYPFLQTNSKAKVYAKPGIFDQKYNGKTRFIGTEYKEEILSQRLIYIEAITEIFPDVFIFPEIKLKYPEDTNFTRLYRKDGISFLNDVFEDELFLTLRKNEQISILTACSHRGITNICATASSYFKLPFYMVLGGFHMKDCGVGQYSHILNYLRDLNPKIIGACHCTGVEKFSRLLDDCNAKVFYNCTGNEVTIK